MPGFKDSISNTQNLVFADNADFSGAAVPVEANGLNTDGQIWLGQTTPPVGHSHVQVMTLTEGTGIGIAYDFTAKTATVSNTGATGTVTSVSGTANQVAVANGTTAPVVSLIGPYTPSTYASNGILYGAATSSIAATTSVNNGVLITSSSGVPSLLADGTTGQVLTATTGSPPTWAAPATSGTVTAVSVNTLNGFAGTSSGGATPALTLTTSQTGILSGNGTAVTGTAITNHGVLTAGASNIVSTVAPGTNGNVLTSNGTDWASTAPVSGSLILIQTQVPTTASSVPFTTGIVTTYKKYLLLINSLIASTGNPSLQMLVSTNGGSSYITSSYSSGVNSSVYNSATITNLSSTTFAHLGTPVSVTAYNATIWLESLDGPNVFYYHGTCSWFDGTNIRFGYLGGSQASTSVNAFTLQLSAGTISALGISLYGLKP